MKTSTLVNPETQVRIQQLDLGVDWHADQFQVVRMAQWCERVLIAIFRHNEKIVAGCVRRVIEVSGPGAQVAWHLSAVVEHAGRLIDMHKNIVLI